MKNNTIVVKNKNVKNALKNTVNRSNIKEENEMSKITEEFIESALRNGVIIRSSSKPGKEASQGVIYAAVIEMANLGFKVDADSLNGVSEKDLTNVIKRARVIVGADRNMKAVYPGFPKQVQELDTMTLIVEQLLHYWSFGTLVPDYPDVVRDQIPLKDIARLDPRETKVMTAREASDHFVKNLALNSIALSDNDKALLRGSIDMATFSLNDATEVIRDAKNGENLQTFVVFAKDKLKNTHSINDMAQAWVPAVHNIDELLRVVLALATEKVENALTVDYDQAVRNLDDSQTKNVRMINLSRPSRRVIMNRLSELSNGFKVDSVVAHRNLWRRVMRMIHPYSLSLDTNAKRASDIIHENIEYKTYNSLVEDALTKEDVRTVVDLLSNHQPGNLLRRLVSILRMSKNDNDAKAIVEGLNKAAHKSRLTTLISAYNGVLVANDTHARVTRVAGLHNSLVEKEVKKVDEEYVSKVVDAIRDAIVKKLADSPAPVGSVGVNNDQAVPLVNRDASTSDREMSRGEKFALSDEGDTIRLFNHWRNNQNNSGYIDTGVVILDSEFNKLDVITWNSWHSGRAWATYSGDKLVYPGDEAVEYIDVDVNKLKQAYPDASWAVLTLQSYSGFPLNDVDVIAGVMVRSEPDSGENFDARTLATAFKPSVASLQAVPLAVDLSNGEMIWVDSSSGSTSTGVSAVNDETVGAVLYDEIIRPRLTIGELAELWAKAHNVETVNEPTDKDAVLKLLQ